MGQWNGQPCEADRGQAALTPASVAKSAVMDDLRTEELRFKQLRFPDELHRIADLRTQIKLPGAGLADPEVAELEKKGMRWVSSADSSGAASS